LLDVDLEISEDSPLVCLVGENGTGKSSILELLSAAANAIGISNGVGVSRGNPFAQPHDVELVAQISVARLPNTQDLMSERGLTWDGRLRLRSDQQQGQRVEAEGDFPAVEGAVLASSAIAELRASKDTQHLFLDADRAYPPTEFQPHQIVELWNQDYRDPAFNKQSSFQASRTLYEEWMKYLVGVEERTGAQLVADIRTARSANETEPTLVDPFDGYRELLRITLPHLRFVGVEVEGARRSVRFNSSGLDLPFSSLSGGEREIAFLTGQIDRFRLQRGLFLVDEPEMHLHPDLLRSWLAFLRDTIQDGQVWFATHSLEAVEVAGPESTFVFERRSHDRTVEKPTRLEGRPVLSALSAAIGSPAFSISRLRFVIVEGDRQTRERERFYGVCGQPAINRFLEGGGCNEVIRRVEMISLLASETEEQLKVGGVIDRDFRTDAEVLEIESRLNVHVLRCHEIENVFLQPEAIEVLLSRSGRDPSTALSVIRDESDRYAGLWIVNNALSLFKGATPKEVVSPLTNVNRDDVINRWSAVTAASLAHIETSEQADWVQRLTNAQAEFEAMRTLPDWWQKCLGKQTLSSIHRQIGLGSASSMERHVIRLWEFEVAIPGAVEDLRVFIDSF
jgi:predicted ATPase